MGPQKDLIYKIVVAAAGVIVLGILLFTQIMERKQPEEDYAVTPTPAVTVEKNVASQAVEDMGIGWNLGNTLDSWDQENIPYEKLEQKVNQYQMMAIYSTENYSGWDASDSLYFSMDNTTCNLQWNITELNSAANQSCGYFAFQIINNAVEKTDAALDLTVTKAEFQTFEGNIVKLEDMLGTYQKSLTDHTTEYIIADLKGLSELKTTSDLLGGTLSITVTINSYPTITTEKISKEEYYETLWGNPVTTKNMIDAVKEAGFGAVRIPVTYFNHINETGEIDEEWLKRVAEIVDYVLDNNMYCVINVHHDTGVTGWLKADPDTADIEEDKFISLWTQISEYFKNYNEKLLFEGYNEILNSKNQWSGTDDASYEVANQLNQAFVDTVRAAGGYNTERCLIINTYGAGTGDEILQGFDLPRDTISHRLIVSTHYYGVEQEDIGQVLHSLNEFFVNDGTPVIIGEFGNSDKMEESARIASAKYYITEAKKYNITCFWWDNGRSADGTGEQGYALLDRSTRKWYEEELMNAMISAAVSTVSN